MRSRKIPFHPPLFALFPILSLFAQNRGILELSDLFHPIGLAVGSCLALWGALSLLARNRWTAAVAASWLFLSFYSFPAVRQSMTLAYPFSAATSLAVWLAVTVAICAGILRSARDLRPINAILNASASVAVAVPFVLSLLSSQLDGDADGVSAAAAPTAKRAVQSSAAVAAAARAAGVEPFPTSSLAELPNVYYIVLDAYGRGDVLRRYYDLDNEEFLKALEARGFYVARRSRSNYGQTYLSLSSSLNSTYLDEVVQRVGMESSDRNPLREMIANNRAAAFFRGRGYAFVVLSSGYTGTEIPNADVYLQAPGAISELGQLLRGSSPLPALDEALGLEDLRYRAHRGRITYALDVLPRAVNGHEPAFVFAHIYAPHPPFIFGPNGETKRLEKEFSTKDGGPFKGDGKAEYVRGYRDQVRFLNRCVLDAVDGILRSPRPAIIVLQGDHGPGSCRDPDSIARSDHRERFSILNAYYFPDRHYGRLYPDINPVNTFRVIFNQYFAANEPLLEERSYASTWLQPYRFVEVTETVRNFDGDREVLSPQTASARPGVEIVAVRESAFRTRAAATH